jgi:sphinganine C4-monooxygenase
MASNHTVVTLSTLLPNYTLTSHPPLIPYLSDFHLSLLLPVIAYWFMSLTFHLIDKYNLWSQYRIHTPEEFKQRNRVSVGEVLRSVIFQQVAQTVLGLWIGWMTSPGDMVGKEEFDVAVWAGRVHWAVKQAEIYIPYAFATIGIDAKVLGHHVRNYAVVFGPTIGTAKNKPLALVDLIFASHEEQLWTSAYSAWEIYAAKTIYWVLEPAARFGIAIFFSDSWQYFWHRAMHSNRWMYSTTHPFLAAPYRSPSPKNSNPKYLHW